MRIVAGKFRGRSITAPAGARLRPSAERLREAVFDILAHGIDWRGFDGARVLDVFAGTGAYGLEALSRGATLATFIEYEPLALSIIRKNAVDLGVIEETSILRLDATNLTAPPWSSGAPFDLAFIDPPYRSGGQATSLAGLTRYHWLSPAAIVVVEIASKEPFNTPGDCTLLRERTYGAGRVALLRYTPRE